MEVFEAIRHYTPDKPSVKQAINAKMKVLREFCVVDKKNEDSIRKYLQAAVDANPNHDYEHVLDRAAQVLIKQKLE